MNIQNNTAMFPTRPTLLAFSEQFVDERAGNTPVIKFLAIAPWRVYWEDDVLALVEMWRLDATALRRHPGRTEAGE
jgi:hypothetical protein